MKKIISLIVAVVLMVSCVSMLNVSAASSSLHFSSSTVDVGDTLTVTVKVSANETMYGVEFALNYDPEILEFVSGDAAGGGAGIVSVAAGADSSSESFSCKFKAIKAGSCNIYTADLVYVPLSETTVEVANQGATVTVKDASLSDNASLKSLSVGSGSLSPSFSASKTSYTVSVDNSVTSCKVYATADDSDAKVSVSGNSDLKVGKNNCTVTVTAPNGTQKTYNIVITRKETDSSSDTSSEDDTSSDETSSDEEASSQNSLNAEIGGTVYTVATSLEGVALPEGFTAVTALYNDIDVAVAEDDGGNYRIYYLSAEEDDKPTPYILNDVTQTFEKLEYFKQGEKFYIFDDIPDGYTVPDGYYTTNTRIGDFTIGCYASNASELSSFYYMYCFNGKDYSFYRYDSAENVIQRYPEMTMALETAAEPGAEAEGIVARFKSLTTNAKIVVLGILLIIIAFLVFVILLVFKLISHRHRAEFVNNLGYEDFDNVDIGTHFSLENDGFLTDEDDAEELEFEDESETEEAPDYLVEDETEEKEE